MIENRFGSGYIQYHVGVLCSFELMVILMNLFPLAALLTLLSAFLCESTAIAQPTIEKRGNGLVIELGDFDFTALSPDGRTLAFDLYDPTDQIAFFSVTTGQWVGGFPGSGFPIWSPDGKSIGGLDGTSIRFWTLQGKPLAQISTQQLGKSKEDNFSRVSFSNTGKRMAFGFENGDLVVVDTGTWRNRLELTGGHEDAIEAIAWGKGKIYSGSYIPRGAKVNHALCVWDDQTGELLATYFPEGTVIGLATSRKDGSLLVSSTNKMYRIDPETGKELTIFEFEERHVKSVGGHVGFLDNEKVVFGTSDNSLVFWESDGTYLGAIPTDDHQINVVELSSNGKVMMTSNGNKNYIYSTADLLKQVSKK